MSAVLAPHTEPADLRERIKELLGKGLSGSVVSSAVGCDPSYISQLLEQEDFREAVQVLRAKGAQGALERDGNWDDLEARTLEKLSKTIDMVYRPADLIKIAQIANSAKRTAKELSNDGGSAGAPVTLILPNVATLHFQMNAQAQVVEVEGRSLAALPTKQLQERLAERRIGREAAGVVDVPIPSTAVLTERRKVVSVLEQIGFSDEAVPVPRVM